MADTGIAEIGQDATLRALAWAEVATGLPHLPAECAWAAAQILDGSFEPDVASVGA